MITLLRDTITYIRNDWLIVAPFWVFFFGVQMVSVTQDTILSPDGTLSYTRIAAYSAVWMAELWIKCVIMGIVMGNGVRGAIALVMTRFMTIMMASILIIAPLAMLLGALVSSGSESMVFQLILFIVFIGIVFPALVGLQFLPIPYLNGPLPIGSGIRHVWDMIREHFSLILRYLMILILISMISLIFSAIFSQVPIIGKSILVVLVQGVIATLMTIFTLKAYLFILTDNHDKPSV